MAKTLGAKRRKLLTNATWMEGDQKGPQGRFQGEVIIYLSLEGRGAKEQHMKRHRSRKGPGIVSFLVAELTSH